MHLFSTLAQKIVAAFLLRPQKPISKRLPKVGKQKGFDFLMQKGYLCFLNL
jgi:hypothetical protein